MFNNKLLKLITKPLKLIFIGAIYIYKWFISPFLSGNCCRFDPSCSTFAIKAIKMYGIFLGSVLIIKRIFKCAFWYKTNKNEFFISDPVPINFFSNNKISNMNSKLRLVVLAAGRSSRINGNINNFTSEVYKHIINKPFLKIDDKTIIEHVINECIPLDLYDITVVINEHETMHKNHLDYFNKKSVKGNKYIVQKDINGTGGAVQAALKDMHIDDSDTILVLLGDTIVSTSELNFVVDKFKEKKSIVDLVIAGVRLKNPGTYGRIVLSKTSKTIEGNVIEKIVEWKNANDEEKTIDLCNTGLICGNAAKLKHYIKQIKQDEISKEYYLTDCVSIANKLGDSAEVVILQNKNILGVNTIQELNNCREKIYKINSNSSK